MYDAYHSQVKHYPLAYQGVHSVLGDVGVPPRSAQLPPRHQAIYLLGDR